ncbi:MAG TPA: beta-ketoacyl-[acyl-carrier-protein] synthase family protein [Pirellulales bacterium]|nr:beta-ketoacyl-[acyl-carrier-protein] synthase family protein [Pirellulales bacterium]
MGQRRDIVITGLGVASPIGIGVEAFWRSLVSGVSGTALVNSLGSSELQPWIAAEVRDFDPIAYVKPRKSLKVMARDSQLALAVAHLAREHASADATTFDPERIGTVFGADTINPTLEDSSQGYVPCVIEGVFHFERWGDYGLPYSFPLNMLKLLPNMLTCHVSIAHDARGPCNTIYNGDVSALQAISEAAGLIERGMADVALAGGASSRMQPLDWLRAQLTMELSQRRDEPQSACRPFDSSRDGQVPGEGAGCLVLETSRSAEARGARPWARLLGWASAYDAPSNGGGGLRRAIELALKRADVDASQLGHVNAHGLGTVAGDRAEAAELATAVDGVPVLAPKSYIGNLFAASGAVEMIASVLALAHNTVPPTLHHRQTDPQCPVSVLDEPLIGAKPVALVVNRSIHGQATAIVIAAA